MSQTNIFTETLIDYIDNAVVTGTYGTIMGGKLILGAISGVDGGSGQPWGGVVGQLAQSLVAYDTAETAIATTASATSLVDNLKHIRYNQLPATWFNAVPTIPRDMHVTITSGTWYTGENTRIEFVGGVTPTITAPTTNPRIDVIYVTTSGTIGIQQGTEAANPQITMPTISGVLPIHALYLNTTASGIGYPTETYSGYIYKDLRPFLTYPFSNAALSGYVKTSTLTTKGDMYVATAAETVVRLPVGVDTYVLTADSSEITGVTWSPPTGGNADFEALLWIGW